MVSISILTALLFLVAPTAQAQTFGSGDSVTLQGYAWSQNIGWISMNGPNYEVEINGGSTKAVTGFAWSANVGWIQFGGLSGFPSGGIYAGNARVAGTDSNWNLEGWARALAYGDGWDGWISLSGASPAYEVSFTNTGQVPSASSYAWGDDVIGWVDFDDVAFTPPCTRGNICTTSPDPEGTILVDMWCDPQTPVYCSAGDICSSGSCIVAPVIGGLDVSRNLVKKGGHVQFAWSVTGVDSCRVTLSTGLSDLSDVSVETPGYPSLTQPSGAIDSDTVFTLLCIETSSGTEVEIDTETVRLLPSVFES